MSSSAEPRPQRLSVPRESLLGLDRILADLGMDGEVAPPAPKPTRARLARGRRRAMFEARGYRRLSRLGAKVEYIAAVPGESTAQVRVDFGPDDRFHFAALSIIQTGRLPRRRPCVARLPRGRRGRARAPRRSASSSATSGADPPEDDEDPEDAEVGQRAAEPARAVLAFGCLSASARGAEVVA